MQSHLWSSVALIVWRLKHINENHGTIPFQWLRCKTCFSEAVSQFIFQRRIATMSERESKPKKGRTHLFCTVWSLRLYFYWVQEATTCNRNKNEVELHSNYFNVGAKYLFCLWKNLTLHLLFFRTFIVKGSPFRSESRWHPKYSTVWYCLIIWSPYDKFNLDKRLVLEKRIRHVLTSPKLTDKLSWTNHSQSV